MAKVKSLESSDLYVVASILTEAGLYVDVENNNKTHKTNILRVTVPNRRASVVLKIKNGELHASGNIPGFTHTLLTTRWIRLHI